MDTNGTARLTWLLLLVALACGACGSDSSSTSSTTSPTAPTSTPAPTTPLPPMSTMLSEKVLGNADAPVTMIEYSSLTCSHCGDFHVITFPLLTSTYIDTGRMKFVYRDYPLNEAAIAGSMVARCSGDNFFATLDALFRGQYSWAFSTDYKSGIKSLVAPLGITSNDVEACLTSAELRSGILSIKAGGTQTHGVSGTPTFLVNGRMVVGALSFAEFSAIINSY
jgi:protein-disulfide isomerase